MKLNLCCGERKQENFINIDKYSGVNPDVICDITTELLPYEDNSIDEVWLSHGLEHIERFKWDFVFMEVQRVLIPNGKFVLAYPEFAVCVQNYLSNKDGQADWWLKTIFGRRLWPGDEHVTACHSIELQRFLESYKFYRVKFSPESETEYYYSLMVAFKDPAPICRELLLADELGLGDGVSIETVRK